LYDGVRLDVSQAELSYHPKSRDSLGLGNLEKYLISYLELKGPMPPVGIALLVVLGGSHSLLDHPYFIHGRLD